MPLFMTPKKSTVPSPVRSLRQNHWQALLLAIGPIMGGHLKVHAIHLWPKSMIAMSKISKKRGRFVLATLKLLMILGKPPTKSPRLKSTIPYIFVPRISFWLRLTQPQVNKNGALIRNSNQTKPSSIWPAVGYRITMTPMSVKMLPVCKRAKHNRRFARAKLFCRSMMVA